MGGASVLTLTSRWLTSACFRPASIRSSETSQCFPWIRLLIAARYFCSSALSARGKVTSAIFMLRMLTVRAVKSAFVLALSVSAE